MDKYYADWLWRNTMDVQNTVAESNKMSPEPFSKVEGFDPIISLTVKGVYCFQANQNLYKTNLDQELYST
jgi:hypothetical protein